MQWNQSLIESEYRAFFTSGIVKEGSKEVKRKKKRNQFAGNEYSLLVKCDIRNSKRLTKKDKRNPTKLLSFQPGYIHHQDYTLCEGLWRLHWVEGENDFTETDRQSHRIQ